MNKIMDTLIQKRKDLTNELEEINATIKSIEKNCKYETWHYEDHDSHNNYEKCIDCGKRRSY